MRVHAGDLSQAYHRVDIVDESFICADRAFVAGEVAHRWPQWWPHLGKELVEDRGLEGLRWSISRPVVGTAEIWLESWPPGVIVHHYVRAEVVHAASTSGLRRRAASRRVKRSIDSFQRGYVTEWKRVVWALKDELESNAGPHSK